MDVNLLWEGAGVARGRLTHYDEARGYGFATPDEGGPTVLIHVDDLEFDRSLLRAGIALEFAVENGEHGWRASEVRLVESASPALGAPSSGPGQGEITDDLCDVLTRREYLAEVTEILLSTVPEVRSDDLMKIRASLLEKAEYHGWIDG